MYCEPSVVDKCILTSKSIKWSKGYPDRQQIVSQITQLWRKYNLDKKTQFDTRVEKVYKDSKNRWIINNESNGRFDGVIACVGTCGDPKTTKISGQENFKGEIFHSSRLDGVDAKEKRILIIGKQFVNQSIFGRANNFKVVVLPQ